MATNDHDQTANNKRAADATTEKADFNKIRNVFVTVYGVLVWYRIKKQNLMLKYFQAPFFPYPWFYCLSFAKIFHLDPEEYGRETAPEMRYLSLFI